MKLFQIICLLLVAALVRAAPPSSSNKISLDLQASLRKKQTTNIFVKFGGGTSSVIWSTERLRFSSRTQKISHLVSSLKSFSESSQSAAVGLLRRTPQFALSAITFKTFWITNELYVRGASSPLVKQLSNLPEVSEIREEKVIHLEETAENEAHVTSKSQVEWSLDIIEAPQAWNSPDGNNGTGVVVAVIDSGVRYTHEALNGNYRESYGWLDPLEESETPVDDRGHGTHCAGSAVGSKGIGVAPGAQWIACRGCTNGACWDGALIECGQWVLCPTLPNGESEDCSKAPHISTNSWGGSQGSDWYNDVINAWKAADIIPVFAVGNFGRQCETASSPGDQDVIGVGATGPTDALWEYSNMGPSVEGKLKPDITAPGHQIRSASIKSDTDYIVDSGTSMATPHVTGAIAILLSRNRNLKYAQVKDILERTAERNLPETQFTCGGIPSTEFPNHQYGHGRLNVRRALEAVSA